MDKNNDRPSLGGNDTVVDTEAVIQQLDDLLSKPKEEGAIQVLERISVNQLLTTMWSPPLPSLPLLLIVQKGAICFQSGRNSLLT